LDTNSASKAEGWDLGFLAAKDTDLRGNQRLRVLGPLFERRVQPDGKAATAVRPLWNWNDAEPRRATGDALWPIASTHALDDQRHWRFLNAYSDDFSATNAQSRYRTVIFPFLFWGRNAQGEPYFACFPLGGKLDEYLTRDRMVFVLFPLYAYSRIENSETYSALWPMFSMTSGGKTSAYRIFPFYGRTTHGDDWTRHFVLWPLWNSVTYNYPQSKGNGYMLFPLFGHVKLTDQETWMALPPFFRWSTSEKLNMLNCPWPIVQYSSGLVDKLYVWPLWGTKKTERAKSSFLVWPIVSWDEMQRRDETLSRFRALPLVQYERRSRPAGTNGTASANVLERYFQFWPLFSYWREGAATRLRALDLWPQKNTRPIESNLAPFWTLYSRRGLGAAAEHELLWGLYRQRDDGQGHRRTSLFPLFSTAASAQGAGARRTKLLMGLFSYEREGSRKALRILHVLKIGLGGAEPRAAQLNSPSGTGIVTPDTSVEATKTEADRTSP
jgi:hypothetical protein